MLRALFFLVVVHGAVFFGVTSVLGYDPDRAFLLRYLVE